MLYHASKIRRLKELVPSPSTHGVPYVYAVKSRTPRNVSIKL